MPTPDTGYNAQQYAARQYAKDYRLRIYQERVFLIASACILVMGALTSGIILGIGITLVGSFSLYKAGSWLFNKGRDAYYKRQLMQDVRATSKNEAPLLASFTNKELTEIAQNTLPKHIKRKTDKAENYREYTHSGKQDPESSYYYDSKLEQAIYRKEMYKKAVTAAWRGDEEFITQLLDERAAHREAKIILLEILLKYLRPQDKTTLYMHYQHQGIEDEGKFTFGSSANLGKRGRDTLVSTLFSELMTKNEELSFIKVPPHTSDVDFIQTTLLPRLVDLHQVLEPTHVSRRHAGPSAYRIPTHASREYKITAQDVARRIGYLKGKNHPDQRDALDTLQAKVKPGVTG